MTEPEEHSENIDYSHYTILLVDDDEDILKLLSVWLKKAGFNVDTCFSAEEALEKLANTQPDLIITDLFMDGMNGLQLLSAIHSENPLMPVIMLSGSAQIQDAVKATHLGSSAFLTKPIKEADLVAEVQRVLRLAPTNRSGRFGEQLIYHSKAMADVMELAETVADSNVTVFISGATGTGKEEVAKAIHEGSSRRDYPFIAVNCGALPEQLLESELFGHEKGSFTGANTRHEGLFMAASGGTIFLDEIGDMPLALQVKLLRVLQDLEVRPVGSVKTYPIDVRIISATHRDLERAVEEGEFREDLYYRLNVVPLRLPPLNERRDDIPVLAEFFLGEFGRKNHRDAQHFSPDAIEYLVSSSWPGNIRQLINCIELSATLCKTDVIPLSIVQKVLQNKPPVMQTLKEVKQECERNYLISVLRISSGNVANAARIAGRNRTEFYKLLGHHDLDPASFRVKD